MDTRLTVLDAAKCVVLLSLPAGRQPRKSNRFPVWRAVMLGSTTITLPADL